MPTRAATNVVLPRTMDVRGVVSIEWTGLLNGDDGAWVALPRFANRSVQVSGTFGVGGSVRLQGTNQVDGAGLPINAQPLNDPAQVVLDVTVARVKQVLEVTRFVRPFVTAGDGTTSLTFTMVMQGVDL